MLEQEPIKSTFDGRSLSRGSIVLISSVAGLIGVAESTAYAATKAGVLGLVRTASEEYAGKGLRINAILPGWTETPLTTTDPRIQEAMVAKLESGAMPMGRIGQPQEIADGIVFLCGGRSSYVTGSALLVDGGYCQK